MWKFDSKIKKTDSFSAYSFLLFLPATLFKWVGSKRIFVLKFYFLFAMPGTNSFLEGLMKWLLGTEKNISFFFFTDVYQE